MLVKSAMEAAKAKAAFAVLIFLHSFSAAVVGVTDPNDLAVVNRLRDGLENAELLKWPAENADPCGPPSWPHLFCSGERISQIQVSGLGLKGPLPPDFNRLSKLYNLGLQKNHFTGGLPSFAGLSELRYAYLDFNAFDEIPPDFFDGLPSLEALALDFNPLNASAGGWSLPDDLRGSAQLKNLTLMNTNLAGPLPEFLGTMPSLEVLRLSGNHLAGRIPASFNGSSLSVLWLNEQTPGMSGPIDVIPKMPSLTSLWLHGNKFSGKIPDNIGDLASLRDLDLNGNELVGLIPSTLAELPLSRLDLNNNRFVGPVPKFEAANAIYESNPFCVLTPGAQCAHDVMALLEFLDGVGYPLRLVDSWAGNDPCGGSWLGIGCDGTGKIIALNLPKNNLSGTISPSIGSLDSLTRIYLSSNDLSGPIPGNFSDLKSLSVLDLSDNDLSPPVPRFDRVVSVKLDGNRLMMANANSSGDNTNSPSRSNGSSSGSRVPSSPSPSPSPRPEGVRKSSRTLYLILAVAAGCTVLIFLIVVISALYLCTKRKKDRRLAPSSLVVHPRDPSDSDRGAVKIAVGTAGSSSSLTGSSANGSRTVEETTHRIEAGNMVISVQVLRKVTKDFAPENELGRGGFGVVYKGELEDGTHIAVKRMESGAVANKALDEFRSEIEVLSRVCHKHLVSLLGYSIEGNERILVYEYMPQGSLSRHLFHWRESGFEPLSWKRRLNVALDVARGMEYLHALAHHSFIHRDLKSSNILLGDDFRAKVSDFGLVKLAPDGKRSVATRLAGTFGYLAPEYAVTGKITTKADVFSFGVVLMELVTGLTALDEDRPEESQYLVPWFWRVKSSRETLLSAVDPALSHGKEEDQDVLESITTVSELAGHCTAREPGQRPDMGHAVNVLASLVGRWRPARDEAEEYCGIDYSLPLNQMVRDWKESEGKGDGGGDDGDGSFVHDLEDSKGSIPTRPVGFADSFTSEDGR